MAINTPPTTGQQPATRHCCRKHEAEDLRGNIFGRNFIACSTCQDKRCAHADDCANACQQPAQPGSGDVVRRFSGAQAAQYSIDHWREVTRFTHAEDFDALKAALTSAQPRIADLHAALRTYGWHKPECDYMQDALPCTCGFMDAGKEQGNG